MDVSKYAALFLAESREHLSSCNQFLLEWERDPAATEPVAALFRAIHTVKGMAATMGYEAIADVAHRTENLLEATRNGRTGATPELLQLLFRAVEAQEVVEARFTKLVDKKFPISTQKPETPEKIEMQTTSARSRAIFTSDA